jgi:hypothetical protein
VGSGASKHMRVNKKACYKLQEQVELGNDVTYPITRVGFVSLCMPSSDVLELDDVLYVPSLMKNHLSVSCMIDLYCIVEFNDQLVIIRRRRFDPSRVLAI